MESCVTGPDSVSHTQHGKGGSCVVRTLAKVDDSVCPIPVSVEI